LKDGECLIPKNFVAIISASIKIFLYPQTSDLNLHEACLSFFSTVYINILQKVDVGAYSLCYSAVIVISVKTFGFTCRLCISYCKLAFVKNSESLLLKVVGVMI